MPGRKFAVFDIDGTLIRWQLYHAIADTLAKEGHINASNYRKIRESRMAWKRRTGETSFKVYERQVVLAYEKALGKLTFEQFDSAVSDVFDEYKDQVYRYTHGLIVRLKKKGVFLLAISGSQTEVVKKVANYYGFDDYVGTIYEYSDQHFTGKKKVAAFDKAGILTKLVKKHGLTYRGSIAVGDSESDAAMMELVERAIAFNPDQLLFEIAKKSGWYLVIERKNMIYELESVDGKYQLVKTNAR